MSIECCRARSSCLGWLVTSCSATTSGYGSSWPHEPLVHGAAVLSTLLATAGLWPGTGLWLGLGWRLGSLSFSIFPVGIRWNVLFMPPWEGTGNADPA
jgi:hypothetical protein